MRKVAYSSIAVSLFGMGMVICFVLDIIIVILPFYDIIGLGFLSWFTIWRNLCIMNSVISKNPKI